MQTKEWIFFIRIKAAGAKCRQTVLIVVECSSQTKTMEILQADADDASAQFGSANRDVDCNIRRIPLSWGRRKSKFKFLRVSKRKHRLLRQRVLILILADSKAGKAFFGSTHKRIKERSIVRYEIRRFKRLHGFRFGKEISLKFGEVVDTLDSGSRVWFDRSATFWLDWIPVLVKVARQTWSERVGESSCDSGSFQGIVQRDS